MGANELSAQLWRERELLEFILFRLEVQNLLLTSGNSRWLTLSTRELEQVTDRMRETGLARTVAVTTVAGQWGISPDADLRELIERAPDAVWADVLASHLQGASELVRQVEEARNRNETLLNESARRTQLTMDERTDNDPAGSDPADLDAEILRANYAAALAATTRVLPPALTDFFR